MAKKYPAKVHYAFNPIPFEEDGIAAGMTPEYTITTGRDEYHMHSVELTPEAFGGRVYLDLADIVGKSFEDVVFRYQEGKNWIDTSFDCNLYSMYQISGGGETRTFTALNGALPLGRENAVGLEYYEVLRKMKGDIIKYFGYPLDIAVLYTMGNGELRAMFDVSWISFDNFQGMIDDDPENAAVQVLHLPDSNRGAVIKPGREFLLKFYTYSTQEAITDNNGEAITDNNGKPITVYGTYIYKEETYTVRYENAPRNAFWVRWINDMGGWEYWMFSCHVYRGKEVSDIKQADVYYERNEEAAGNLTYSKEANETTAVSSGQVDLATLEILSNLPKSPRIEWYDKAVEKWMRIEVDDTEITYGLHQPTGEIEFTFIMPKPQIQF